MPDIRTPTKADVPSELLTVLALRLDPYLETGVTMEPPAVRLLVSALHLIASEVALLEASAATAGAKEVTHA